MNGKIRRNYLILILLLLIIVIGGLILSLRSQSTQFDQAQDERKILHLAKLDRLVDTPSELLVSNNIEKNEAQSMPKLILGLPSSDWFTASNMQQIGFHLGITNKADLQNLDGKVIWQDGRKNLLINREIGTVILTSDLGEDNVSVSEEKLSLNQVKIKLNDFFVNTKLPATYFDFSDIQTEFMEIGSTGSLIPALAENAEYLKASVPVKVSGVTVTLPIENYIVINGQGDVVMFSFLIPNIQQEGEDYPLISYAEAQNLYQDGVGVVVKSSEDQLSKINADKFNPGYYINLGDFYAVRQQRLLVPVFIFSGPEGSVAILAENTQ
jgi:hypothetical protein